jgi:hypothetical protein
MIRRLQSRRKNLPHMQCSCWRLKQRRYPVIIKFSEKGVIGYMKNSERRGHFKSVPRSTTFGLQFL